MSPGEDVSGEVRDAGGAETRDGVDARPNPIRRLYDWVLSWADRPGGPAALFGLAAAESVFFPVPPDVLLIPMSLGKPRRALRFAALCTVGSVLGGILGYWVGAALYRSVGVWILDLYGYHDVYARVGELYRQNLVVALGAAGFTPIPYKVFTLAAGGFSVSFPAFIVISAVSRGARFFLVAGLLRIFGRPVRDFIDRWFNLLTILLAVLVIGGFVVLRWVL